MDIENVIKELRRKEGWEQDDLAKRLGTTQQTISNWENGSLPRLGALKKLIPFYKMLGCLLYL